MKLSNLNEWLSFLANLGVLVGIIFLIIELQQTNRIARVSAEYELRNNFSNINEINMTDREYSEFVIDSMQEDFSPDEVDSFRIAQVVNRFLNIWLAAAFSYENGIASEMIYNNVLDDARLFIGTSSPASRVIFRQQLDSYPALHSTELFGFLYSLIDNYDEHGREKQ